MNETKEIDTKLSCEFCKRSFVQERNFMRHICEPKRRWLDKDKQSNRIAFQCFVDFFRKQSASKKAKTYEDFIKSPYYGAFMKFGNYCIDVNCINISRFCDWLLKDNHKIDYWCSDSNYNKFLIEYLKAEDAYDAIKRGIQYCMEIAPEYNLQYHDLLRFGNAYKICHAVTTGKISPWMLYQSSSGVEFLSKLDPTQEKIVLDYINPEHWAIKFLREADTVVDIKKLLKDAGY